jgi:hypothetical protein
MLLSNAEKIYYGASEVENAVVSHEVAIENL